MTVQLQVEGFKAAAEIAKQIIALSTGAVAFTVTFLEKFTHPAPNKVLAVPPGLYVGWVLFGLTVLFAMWNLMAITGSLEAIDRKMNGWPLTPAQELSANGDNGNGVLPAYLMIGSFLLAIVAIIWVGFSL